MSNGRNIHACLGLALVMGFALSACVASSDAPSSSVAEGAIGEAGGAVVTIVPPGTTLACTLSAEIPPTNRRWGYLTVGQDASTCYRSADPARAGEPAPTHIAHCKGLAIQLGCDTVEDL